MWIVLAGAPGTSKEKIAEWMKTDGFEFEGYRVPVFDEGSLFEKELALILAHINKQLEIQKIMDHKDIVTVRSLWETTEVYARVAFERTEITHRQFTLLKDLVSVTDSFLKPPHAFVYLKPEDKMASYDRMLLTDNKARDEFDSLCAAYEKFIARVGVPVVEVNHKAVIDQVIDQVRFGVGTIKASALAGETIWQRHLYK